MISLEDVQLRRGGELLLDGATVTLHAGWKVGVVGRNGAGKSSLFELVRGELPPDRGRVSVPRDARMVSMAQELAGAPTSALEFVLQGDEALEEVRRALKAAEARDDHAAMARLHERMDALDGYTARSRGEQTLAGLGFSKEAMEAPVASFSGGWRIRLNLARALIQPSEILLLDEPTNHLDLDAALWLEQWLLDYPGTLLLISHDRDFLDHVVGHVVHFEGTTLRCYRGNYTAFERQRAERLAQQEAQRRKQQQRIAEIEAFVARFRAKASKARQAQSRLKELERMQEIAPAHVDSPFRFAFPEADKVSDPLITVRDGRLGHDGTPVLEGVGVSLHPGQRVGLLGPNGAGKSTLVRTLLGELPLIGGERIPGTHLAPGYFAQHQLDALDVAATPLQHLQRLTPEPPMQAMRDFLGGFGFSGDDALEPVGQRSGGEKARLALALVAWRRPNVLLLDEPTNHLDLEMRHALDVALQEYSGAVVLVTHDRHLLRETVDTFWLVADGTVAPFDGTLEDYRAWLRARREEASGGRRQRGSRAGDARREAARQREAVRPLRQEVARLEEAVEERRAALAGIEAALADPALYGEDVDPARLQELMKRQADARRELAELEEAWLDAAERLEATGATT